MNNFFIIIILLVNFRAIEQAYNNLKPFREFLENMLVKLFSGIKDFFAMMEKYSCKLCDALRNFLADFLFSLCRDFFGMLKKYSGNIVTIGMFLVAVVCVYWQLFIS